jgi:hypothetical protein
LWAIRNVAPFPAADFQNAWRDVLLYSEHTWGAHNSIGEPDLPFVKDQWKVKRAFALDADTLSQQLLLRAGEPPESTEIPNAVDVFNTSSWSRTDLVTLSHEQSSMGDQVSDDCGAPILSPTPQQW